MNHLRMRRHCMAAIAGCAAMAAPARGQELLADWDSQHGSRSYDDMFGYGVSHLGDIDLDGWPEVMVASSGYDVSWRDSLEGAVFVMSTKDGSFLQKQFGSAKLGRLGWSADGGADFNGDGVLDYIAGAPYETGNANSSGVVHVYSGADGSELFAFSGERANDSLGWSVAIVDDVDLDGTRDIAAVTRWWDNYPLGVYQCGRGYCYSGRTGTLLWTFDGTFQDQWIYSCCPLDDFNGDGVPEVGFGSVGGGSGASHKGEGHFDVVDGTNGSSLLCLYGEKMNDGFGVCGRTGDIDRDGVRDVFIGAAGHSTGGYQAGRLYLYSGATFSLLQQFDGEGYKELLGYTRECVPSFDADGDGWTDIIFRSPNRIRVGCWSGVLLLYSGRTGRLLYELRSRPEWGMADLFGTSGDLVGDLTGDGIPDLVVGAGASDGSPQSWLEGHAFLVGMKRIFVQCDAGEYWPGDPITLQLRGGTPGVLGLVAVVGIDGAPVFETVAVAPLDSYGELTLTDVADSSLTGLTIEFMGFCQKPNGRGLLTSAVDFVHFR